ncbi:MAG: hypothetical protein RL238_1969 [Actinomycetota bacterium]
MGGVSEQLRDSRESMAGVLRNRSLRKVSLALVGSVIGDWAYIVAMSIYAYDRGGPGVVGALAAVRFVSTALLAPFASVAADKFDRRRVMIAADLARAGIVTVAAVAVMADAPALAVYALTIVSAWLGLLFRPSQSALVPTLADTPSELTAANVTTSTIHSVGFFVGPSIAGLLLAFTGVGAVLVFNALTFVWSAVLVFGIRVRHAEPDAEPALPDAEPEPAGEPERMRLLDGYRVIARSRDLRLLVMLYVAQTVVAGAAAVYEVSIALDLLDLGDSGLGVMNAVLGVGGVVGGVLALVLAQSGKQARDVGLGVALWATPLLLVAAWPYLLPTLVAMALIGLGNSLVDVNAETIIQRLVPDEVLGRVFGALDSAAIAGMALGAAVMPLLISSVGLRTGLVVVAAVVTSVVLLSQRGLRRVDRVALAPEGLPALRGVPMLAVLPEHTIERLARTSAVVEVRGGTAVFEAGDHGDRFYIVEAGTAEVLVGGAPVASLTTGDSFGEIALLRDVPRTATVRATADLRLRAIDRRHFLRAVTGHAEANEQAELVVNRFTDVA